MKDKINLDKKIEVLEKFVKGRLVGMMKDRELTIIKAAETYGTPENRLDSLFENYLINLIDNQKDKDYWILRYYS